MATRDDLETALAERWDDDNLAVLHVRGRRLFDELPHPHLRALSIQGFDALGSLSGAGPALPALQRLDFAFFDDAGATHWEHVTGARLAALLPAARPRSGMRSIPCSRGAGKLPGSVAHGS